MPMIIIRRVPLPSVSIYLILSASLLMLAVMWANNTLVEEQELLNATSAKEAVKSKDIKQLTNNKNPEQTTEFWSYPPNDESGSDPSLSFSVKRDVKDTPEEAFIGTLIAQSISAGNYSFAYGVLKLMLDEPLCLMLVVNATYCVLIVVMHVIQKIIFGKLRPIERQHIKDKFWNFVFYKFIFIFGVMNVQSLNEVLIWVSWFTAIAFLLLLTKLSKDRFEFLSFSPNTPMFYHWKVIGLLNSILFFCILLGISCIVRSFPFSSFAPEYYDVHSTTFMLAETVMIAIKAIHVLLRYGIHLYDIQHTELWERKATLVYHVDLVMELLSLFINFIHHLHMLFSGNIWLSMASLVICMQLRFIFTEIQKRYLRHKNYRRVVANMDAQFPAASAEELTHHEDRCAICWDQMESARKLPCGHLFHAPCLRSWLEQDTTCPTCRKQLGIRQSSQDSLNENSEGNVDNVASNIRPGGVANQASGVLNPTAAPVVVGPQRNHFWHFDGSRIASWLPSFSVEVTHSPRGSQSQLNEDLSNSQLDSMVRDVQEIFPQVPVRVITQDLRMTGSVEATTNNILEGNIVIPPDQIVLPSTPAERQSEFSAPLTTRSQPTLGSSGSTLRHRHVTSFSDSELRQRRNLVLPSVSNTESMTSIIDENIAESSSSSGSLFPSPPQSPTYGHFSKAPEERELVLQNRRDLMIRQARLKYLNKTLKNAATEPTAVRSDETHIKSSSAPHHSTTEVAHTSSALHKSSAPDRESSDEQRGADVGVERDTSPRRSQSLNKSSESKS